MTYTELRTNAAHAFYHHFLYDEDMVEGRLVRISADNTVSHLSNVGAALVYPGDASNNIIGTCRQNKVNALENPNDTDLVDVELFGFFRAVAEYTLLGTLAAGATIALQNGQKAVVVIGGDQGDTALLLVP
jgi:hypothetical protein